MVVAKNDARAPGAVAPVPRSRGREGIHRAGLGRGPGRPADRRGDRPRPGEPAEDVGAGQARARSAVTRITRAHHMPGVTLCQVAIHTGRTHQIRVHLSAIGHPIVGDSLYGGVHRRVAGDIRARAAARAAVPARRPAGVHAPARRPPDGVHRAAAAGPDERARRPAGMAAGRRSRRAIDAVTDADRARSQIRTVFDGPGLHRADRDRSRCRTGGELDAEIVRHPGSVVLIPVTDAGRDHPGRQYRHAIGRWAWELPAGSVEAGRGRRAGGAARVPRGDRADPGRGRAARRVLPDAGLLRRGDELLPASGLRAPGAATKRRTQDEDEDIEAQAFSLADDRATMIARGEIIDLKTVAGLALL